MAAMPKMQLAALHSVYIIDYEHENNFISQ